MATPAGEDLKGRGKIWMLNWRSTQGTGERSVSLNCGTLSGGSTYGVCFTTG